MLLFYIDESGTGLKDEQTPFFVLASVAIPIEQWQRVDSQVNSLKRRLVSWAKPEDFEIKGRDLQRGEKLFKSQNWDMRARAIHQVAELIEQLPCRILAVQIDKRDLPDYVGSDNDLYRLTFWRLLDELEQELERENQNGMLMVDMRSDMHSSVQDRRLIDVYREWLGSRTGQTQLVEVPWFGFSAFYSGLQLADFAAYVIDHAFNDRARGKRSKVLHEAFAKFKTKTQIVRIP